MVFVAAGILAGPDALDLVSLDATHGTAFRIAELALAILLFSDAARIDVRSLRGHATSLAAMTVTVLASVVLHGLSARPLVAAYARTLTGLGPDAPELSPKHEPASPEPGDDQPPPTRGS